MAGLTAVDVDRARSDERSLAVMWLNRRTLQQKQKAPTGSPKRRATAANAAPQQANRRLTRSFTRARACIAASSRGSACALARARAVPTAA
jgi:hypothetical protein